MKPTRMALNGDRATLPLIGFFAAVVCGYLPVPALAGSSCYEESYYPSVTAIFATDDGFRAAIPATERNDNAGSLYHDETMGWRRGWRRGTAVDCVGHRCGRTTQGCEIDLPEISFPDERAQRLFGWSRQYSVEQRADACVRHDGNVYFGIGYYSGEGFVGVGGLGRFDPESGDMEIRRPHKLMDTSVTFLRHDGKWLWVATADHRECSGTPPSERLFRYNWETGEIREENGMCGFVVHDMLLTDDAMWVATDLGLSQKTHRNGSRKWSLGWRNYIPDLKVDGGVRHVWCDRLYAHLLDELPRGGKPASPSPFDQTVASLGRYEPRFLADYLAHKRGEQSALAAPERAYGIPQPPMPGPAPGDWPIGNTQRDMKWDRLATAWLQQPRTELFQPLCTLSRQYPRYRQPLKALFEKQAPRDPSSAAQCFRAPGEDVTSSTES